MKDAEYLAQYRKEYYIKNRDILIAKSMKYVEEHKETTKEYQHKYYKKNKERISKLVKEYNRINTKEKRRYDKVRLVDVIKLMYKYHKMKAVAERGFACEECGHIDDNISVYEFHHIDPKTKVCGLNCLFKKQWSKKLDDELAKCKLLCANCHRKAHHPDYGKD